MHGVTDQYARPPTSAGYRRNRSATHGPIAAAMGRYIHPEAVIIFPDGRVLVGVDGLKAYYELMTAGDEPIVASFTSDPQVKRRAIEGDTVVSQGVMNDRYVLTDGTELALDSRFTATLIKTPDGPPETGGYVIRSFHCSTDAFDNNVLDLAVKKAGLWSAIPAAAVALLIGVILGLIAGRASTRRTA